MVGILHDIPGRVRAPGAEIHGIHDLGVGFFGPVAEFMKADLVGLGGEPGKIQALRPLVTRADGVLPVEAGNEVAAGITDDGNAELPDHVDDILPESVLIRGGMAGLIDAAVHRAAQVLNERTVHAGVDPADGEILVQDQGCLFHMFSSRSELYCQIDCRVSP